MKRNIYRNNRKIRACLFVLLSLVSRIGLAVDINSASNLKNYLGRNSTLDDVNTVRLKKDIGSCWKTITIKSGTIILNLASYEIPGKGGINQDLFNVQGGFFTILGSGTITTSAGGGNALTISGGNVVLKGGTFESISGKAIETTIKGKSLLDYLAKGYGYYVKNKLQTNPGQSLSGNTTVKVIQYKLNYNNSSLSSTSYSIDSPLSSFPEPSSSGAKFGGWYLDEDFTKQITSVSELPYPNNTETVNLYAKWIYSITYDFDGGQKESGGNYPETYQKGDDIVIGKAIRNNDRFKGWRETTGDWIGQILQDNRLPLTMLHPLNLIAVWDPQYTISFDTGTDEVTNPAQKKNYVSEMVTLPTVEKNKTGYIFGGWKDSSGKEYRVGEEVQFNGDITLTAVWNIETYTVTFKDGADEQKTTYQIGTGSKVVFPKKDKDGWIFSGWKNSSGNYISSIKDTEVGNQEFTAGWTEIKYRITYVYKNNTTDDKTIEYTYAQSGAIPLESASRKDYNFLGWFLPNSTAPLDKLPVDLTKKEKVVLFTATASWGTIPYPVKFYLNDGTDAVLDKDKYIYTVEKGIGEEDMPSAIRTGYEFAGWFDNQDGNGISWSNVPAGSGELKLYAKWIPKMYRITYYWQGGKEVANAPKSFVYNVGVALPGKDVMKKEHYTFVGWAEEATSSKYEEFIPANTEGDKTFYAQWTPKVYTIKYNTNGGSEILSQSYLYGTEAKAKKTYKTGYILTWYYDAALTKLFGDRITSDKILDGMSEEFTLYAKWTPTEYNITYNTYYGEIISGKVDKYTIEQEVPLPDNVSRDGFSFAGWYADDALVTKMTKIGKGNYGNKTFYATWDRGYQIIFTQPSHGNITVTRHGNIVPAGTMIGKGESLTVTAEATDANYELKQLLINGKPFTSSPQLVTMPKEDLKITAEFTEASTPAASAPELIITPSGVNKFPKGEDVKVQLKKTDESTTLYYSLDGSAEKKYEREFAIGSAQDTVLLKAIARKSGFRDGVTSRYIIFDNGKITLTFDLPLGVKAVNPSGGEVVTATTTGGSFEFELKVDKEYYTNLDSMVVSANDSIIKPGSAGLYTLANCSSDVTVTVSGLKAKVCTVTLQQTGNGNISFTDGAEETTMEVDYGASVSITAKADEDFKFLQWSTGSQSNPLKLTVDRDTTISARFISDYKAYAITLPQLEGVTVKPFSGYSTEVKKDGTFKFYLKLADGYREENLVVRANGEELEKNKGGYAIYYINKNISISVEGIVREPIDLKVPENVQAKVVETMTDPSGERVYGETMILLYAEAPAGKTFSKWTDGKTDNPRLATAQDAAQLHPLFVDKEDENYAKVTLHQSPGAAITTVNANIDAVKKDEMVQLKVVLLPAYSQSDVILTVDDQVVKPEISLRAASETKTHVFFVPVTKDDIMVKVSGIKRNSYHVSVAQTRGGTVSATSGGEITHGETVRLKAQPEPGMLFIKWWDGNTLNPYPYVVTSDTEVKAYFVGTESTVDNETIRNDENVGITVGGGTLSILTAEASMVYIWDHKGALFHAQQVAAGRHVFNLPAGIYLIKVGNLGVKKVMVGGPSSI